MNEKEKLLYALRMTLKSRARMEGEVTYQQTDPTRNKMNIIKIIKLN